MKEENEMDRDTLFRGKRLDNGEGIEGFYLEHERKAYICAQPYCCSNECLGIAPGYGVGFSTFIEVDRATVCRK